MKYRISSPEKFVIRILIASVLWLSMGSLVNFHMNRIFGEELLSPTLFCNRQKDKVLKESKVIAGASHDFNPQPGVMPEALVPELPIVAAITRTETGHAATPADSGFSLHGLRAPPLG